VCSATVFNATNSSLSASPTSPSAPHPRLHSIPPLFLSTLSPSSPHSSHRLIFCLRCLSILPPSLAVATNACHLHLYQLARAHRACPSASRIPIQDHALKNTVVTSYRTFVTPFSMFPRYAFILGAPARLLAAPLHIILWTSNLVAFVSTPRPLSRRTLHTFVAFNLNTGSDFVFTRFSFSFSPFMLTFARSLCLSLATWNRINTPTAWLEKVRQLWPRFPPPLSLLRAFRSCLIFRLIALLFDPAIHFPYVPVPFLD